MIPGSNYLWDGIPGRPAARTWRRCGREACFWRALLLARRRAHLPLTLIALTRAR
jgi:hypothetical protein